MKLNMGPNNLLGAVLTLFASFRRVLVPMATWPPPSASEVYDAYIALSPMVTHFVLTFLWVAVQVFFAVGSPSFLAVSDRLVPWLVVVDVLAYIAHAPLSRDQRTGGLPDARLGLIGCLVAAWAVVSFRDLYSRGLYARRSQEQLYTDLRGRLGFLPFLIISFIFMALKTLSTFFLLQPVHFAWNARRKPPYGFTPAIVALSFVCLLGVVLKHVASRQRLSFMRANPGKGYVTGGVYSWVRQPGALAELVFWWGIYAFGCILSRTIVNWSFVGPLLYTSQVMYWAIVSERTMAVENIEYRKDVQPRVWMLLPLPPRSRPGNVASSAASVTNSKKTK